MARARSTIGGLKKLLAECAEPVYVVDDERRLVYCNPACVAWTGWPLEQLLGAQCDYHTRPDGPASAGLGPPPEAFQSATWEARVSCRRPDGTLAGCAAHFHRLSRGEAPPAVLVLLADRPSLAEPAQAEVPASQLHECLAEMRQAMGRLHAADQFVGVSPAITRVRDQVHLATAARSPVLIQGPPGSERERVARTIHYLRGGQQPETLVPLSCALLDPELLQTTVHAFLRRQPSRMIPSST